MLFTPRRILIGIAIVALALLFRECLKNRGGEASRPNELNVRFDAAATNLNPFLTSQGSDIYLCARIFQTLGELDPKTLELQPVMLEKIPAVRTVNDGPHAGELAYDFELLPEAAWDNGSAITGNDMAFTLKLIFHPLLASKAYMSYFKDLSGVDVDQANPKKFTVYFRHYYILALESMCQTPIMPAYHYDPLNHLLKAPIADFLDTAKLKSFETDADMKAFFEEFQQAKFANNPASIVGSGAYRLEQMNDQGAILVKKDNWWGDKVTKNPLLAAYPKKIIYKVVKSENALETMLKNGELDVVAGAMDPAKFMEMKQKDSINTKYDFEVLPALGYSRWVLNLSKPGLKDIQVRKALAHIVDYDHFIKNIRLNMAMRIMGPIAPGKRYYAKDMTPYDFNIQKAKELLAQAGWTDSNGDGIADKNIDGKNVKLTIEVLVAPVRVSQLYMESLTETARLAGIELKSISTDIALISTKTKSGDYDSAVMGTSVSPGLTELSQRYHSKYLSPAGDNRSRYVNTKVDTLIERIDAEPNDSKRDQLYVEVQKIIYDELPEIFLFSPNQPVITAKKFEPVITANRPGYLDYMFKLK